MAYADIAFPSKDKMEYEVNSESLSTKLNNEIHPVQ